MKKHLLMTALIASIGLAYANDEAAERAKDHAQPIPDANIKAETVTRSTTTKVVGTESNPAISKTTTVTVDNSETGQVSTVEQAELILPEPKIINNQMSLGQTISTMKSAFSKLANAETVSAMRAPANTLADYAGQASLLLESAQAQSLVPDPVQAMEDLKQLRALLVELQSALINEDLALAKTKVDVIASAQDGFYRHFSAK